jgi:hypothetical protein
MYLLSLDAVFNENFFPFASLHTNTGTRLHAEILLLPHNNSPPPSYSKDVANHDRMYTVLNYGRYTEGKV